jgi:hypothetical protein
MKLRIGENNINDIALETDDGQDFFKILNDNGLIVSPATSPASTSKSPPTTAVS